MSRKISLCIAIAFLTVMVFSVAKGSGLLPGDDPNQFRKSLHPDFSSRTQAGMIVIPDLVPPANAMAAKANFNDLLISETVGPANFDQDKADITGLRGGRMAAVWEDDRFGPVAIFLQLFGNDGGPIGTNTPLVFGQDYDLSDPVVCADTLGDFYVVWREDVNGFLQAARFDSLADTLTEVFFISDTVFSSYAGEFDAACTPDGKLAVVWENYTTGSEIAFQIFDTDGGPLTSIITANSDGSLNQHWSPEVVVGVNNDIALVWEDYRNSEADIYFRLFNSSGAAYASEFRLSDESARDYARYMPSLVYSSIDGYIAGWTDLREGWNLYLQRIDASGTLNGANIFLSGETSQYANRELDLTVNSLDCLVAVWTLYGTQNSTMMQRFSAGVLMDGSAQVVSDAVEGRRFNPAAGGARTGNIGVVWTDLITGSIDIFGAFHTNTGTVLQSPFVVNDDTAGSPSVEPHVVGFDRFEWSVVFTDLRRDAGDIMLQRVYVGGELLDGNRRINADAPGGYQSQPAVAAGAGKLCISWTDDRSDTIGGQNIFCRFSCPTYELTPEIVINDDYVGSFSHYESNCAINDDGLTLVVWTDTRSGNAKIFGQLFNGGNDKLGDNFLIGPGAPAKIGGAPVVLAYDDWSFMVAYLNRLDHAVEIKKVSAAGSVTDAFTFTSDRTGFQIDGFDAAIGSGDLIYIVWHAFNAGQTELFLTSFNPSGTIQSITQAITDDMQANPDMADIAANQQGYLLVTWPDSRTGQKTPFRQIFDPALLPIQGNQPAYASAGPYMRSPVVAANFGRGIFVWSDARSNGLNVYASQLLFSPTSADDDTGPLPSMFGLKQNYPNPFNPSTTIDFMLPKTGHIKIGVINLLGQKVRTVIDGVFPAGSHSIIWDGTSDDGRKVASGVYFYRMESDSFNQTRKMILMK
jgi:hypothetical protein